MRINEKISQMLTKRSQTLAILLVVLVAWIFDRSNFNVFERASEAVALGTYLEERAPFGACFRGQSLLPHLLPDAHCHEPTQDWIAKVRDCLGIVPRIYDWQHALLFFSWLRPKPNCESMFTLEELPGRVPELSMILTLFNNEKLAIEAIFELFIYSKEVNGIEFIIIDDGSTENLWKLKGFLISLKYKFGISYNLLRNSHPV
jgi:hypothetical protein